MIQNANRNISWIFQRHQAVNVNSEPPPQQRKAIVLKIPFTLDKASLKLQSETSILSFGYDCKKSTTIEIYLNTTFKYDKQALTYSLTPLKPDSYFTFID